MQVSLFIRLRLRSDIFSAAFVDEVLKKSEVVNLERCDVATNINGARQPRQLCHIVFCKQICVQIDKEPGGRP